MNLNQNSSNIQTNNTQNLLALNVGYGKVKICYQNKYYSFDSKISDYVDEELSKTILYDGKRYAIGEGLSCLDLDKSKSEFQKIIISYVLSKIDCNNLTVICAMPINQYKLKSARMDYKAFMESFDKVKKCIVYMESARLVVLYPQFFSNKVAMIIDIGGYTANVSLYDNGTLIKDNSFSIDLGYLILESRIKTKLEQSDLCIVNERQIKYMQDNPVVKNVIEDYIKELKLEMARHKIPSNIPIYATGGGSLFLRNKLVENFNVTISDLAIYENVLGLYKIGGILNE